MRNLIKVQDHKRLSIQELYALAGKDKNICINPRWKGEIFMSFKDKESLEVKRRRHIYNTRTWMVRNVFQNDVQLNSTRAIVIANDDGDWHVHKNVIRATYQDNGGTYFADTTTTLNNYPSTYIIEIVAQFDAAPAGTTKTINAVAISSTNNWNSTSNARVMGNIIAATTLPSPETQDEYTIIDITYKLTFSI